MLSVILLATQVLIASPPAVAPAAVCETGGAAGIIVQGGKTANTGIIVQGGLQPSADAGIIVQGGKTAGSGIIVQGGLQPNATSDPAATDKCEKPKL